MRMMILFFPSWPSQRRSSLCSVTVLFSTFGEWFEIISLSIICAFARDQRHSLFVHQNIAMTAAIARLLRPHWEAHQRDHDVSRKIGPETRASQIWKELNEHALVNSMDRLQVDDKEKKEEGDTIDDISQCLVDFLENAMISLVETNGESREAAESILELLAAVAVSELAVLSSLLNRTASLLKSPVDSIRAMACYQIGWIVSHIYKQTKTPTDTYTASLDRASQALLPMFTDKMQPVRLAAIVAGSSFFSGDSTDSDILQAMLWCMQHDPSHANREAALQRSPINLETIGYVIHRIRDVKPKVRVAALDALHRVEDLSLLDAEQCVEIVEAGFTER